MSSLLIRLVINAIALWVAAQLVTGIRFDKSGQEAIGTILIVALIFGAVNALIKPVIKLVTCPFHLLTLGLFTFLVNAFMLSITSYLAERFGQGFVVDDFLAAFLGSLVISIVSTVLSFFERD